MPYVMKQDPNDPRKHTFGWENNTASYVIAAVMIVLALVLLVCAGAFILPSLFPG